MLCVGERNPDSPFARGYSTLVFHGFDKSSFRF